MEPQDGGTGGVVAVVVDNKNKTSKKRKRSSPFRIKVGCLVAIRYRSKGNHVLLEQPQSSLNKDEDDDDDDGDDDHSSVTATATTTATTTTTAPLLYGGDLSHDLWGLSSSSSSSSQEPQQQQQHPHEVLPGLMQPQLQLQRLPSLDPVTTAHFCEVWTDPQPGRDDGLALIGSRIKVVFPKSVLLQSSENGGDGGGGDGAAAAAAVAATERIVEGEVVGIVDYEKQYTRQREAWRQRQACPILVDLLIDNRNNKSLKAMPFLQRVDESVTPSDLAKMKESERRGYQNEVRIKGGPHRAIVRVLLCDVSSFAKSSSSSMSSKKNKKISQGLPEGRWVVRKRVLTKVVRAAAAVDNNNNNKSKKSSDKNGTGNKTKNGHANGKVHFKGGKDDNQDDKSDDANGKDDNPDDKDVETGKPPRKRRKVNKDFLLPRYLGDGNDPESQQEFNWRWQAARYFHPYMAVLGSERPISMELLERLSYNFVGEVVAVRHASDCPTTTLAMVSVRLLVLPEHTRTGRMANHDPFDAFECEDLTFSSMTTDATTSQKDSGASKKGKPMSLRLQVPIEELVIVRRKIQRPDESVNGGEPVDFDASNEMVVRHSYSFENDTYSQRTAKIPLRRELDGGEAGMPELRPCRRCRKSSQHTKRIAGVSHLLCEYCIPSLRAVKKGKGIHTKTLQCDCNLCLGRLEQVSLNNLSDEVVNSVSKLRSTLEDLGDYTRREGFIATRFVMKGMAPVDFAFSPSMEAFTSDSSAKVITKVRTRVPKKVKKSGTTSAQGSRLGSGMKRVRKSPPGRKTPTREAEAESKKSVLPPPPKEEGFRPTSSRLLPYNVKKRKFNVPASDLFQWRMYRPVSVDYPEKPRNLRLAKHRVAGINSVAMNVGDSGEKKLTGRAARAKQRRVQRGVASMGLVVDTLAGRETQLRFDRSGIHDWGVFVDTDVKKGEMIVEYRGEIIENAVADKREKEYIDAKIGSDYMFRIDELTVCDATKQGNVARFINASCDPNCHTKIISLDGTKRIVIYAKKDIAAGSELCYDYKFALEDDPEKRIPCGCGADNCRGFLNWDKRLSDDVSTPESSGGGEATSHAKRIKGM